MADKTIAEAAREAFEQRENALAKRSIGYGLSLLRIVREERLEYVLQTESEMSLDQVDEFLDMLAGGPTTAGRPDLSAHHGASQNPPVPARWPGW